MEVDITDLLFNNDEFNFTKEMQILERKVRQYHLPKRLRYKLTYRKIKAKFTTDVLTSSEYEESKARITYLMSLVDAESYAKEIYDLGKQIQRYEKIYFPI
jgi:hypothetical protein